MAEVSNEFVDSLKAVRGEFQNTKGGKIGNRFLAHVFSTLFPIVFIGYLIFWSGLSWPLSGESWLFIAFTVVTCGVGIVLHRAINSHYLFDDLGIQEIRSNGQVKKSIPWTDLAKVEYRESRGIKSFTLKTSTDSMHLEFYKSLSEAIYKIDQAKKQ